MLAAGVVRSRSIDGNVTAIRASRPQISCGAEKTGLSAKNCLTRASVAP
jgi:hypothetical protein